MRCLALLGEGLMALDKIFLKGGKKMPDVT